MTTSYNLDVYMPVVILMGFAVGLVLISVFVAQILRPFKPSSLKEQAYECGEDPVGTAWSNFNVRFYVVSLIFIVFDVEGALMFPVASIFRKFVAIGEGGVLVGSLLIFISVLVFGVIYCWSKGDLDWVRSFQISDEQLNQLKGVEENS
ncbi:MAG: NADH-quinone oxidoreductase subunit A [Halobacteriovoraceae bacterium]|nr:NADH-quinone oxidoreductase subunit A [Halobacteriovoraceae bacterium]